MADQAVVERSTHRLAEAELAVLRHQAREQMLDSAHEMVRSYDPELNGESEAAIQAREEGILLAAGAVYGVLDGAALAFGDHRGPSSPAAESVEVAFSDASLAWLRKEREETRHMLAEQRGGIEICDYANGTGSSRDTFLLFVLDGIFAGEQVTV